MLKFEDYARDYVKNDVILKLMRVYFKLFSMAVKHNIAEYSTCFPFKRVQINANVKYLLLKMIIFVLSLLNICSSFKFSPYF